MPASAGTRRGVPGPVRPGRQGLRHRGVPGGRRRPGRRGGDTAPALPARPEALRRAPLQAAPHSGEHLREDQEVAGSGHALLQEGLVLRGGRADPLPYTLATHLVTTLPRQLESYRGGPCPPSLPGRYSAVKVRKKLYVTSFFLATSSSIASALIFLSIRPPSTGGHAKPRKSARPRG